MHLKTKLPFYSWVALAALPLFAPGQALGQGACCLVSSCEPAADEVA